MSEGREADLARLLDGAGLGWLGRSDASAVSGLLGELDKAGAEYQSRFGTRVDLLAACNARPEDTRALLQALAASVSPPLLAMVARVLLRKAEVVEVRFDFVSQRSSRLHLVVADPEGARHEFDSDRLWDVEVLRHFGLMMVDGKPAIDGFYAARTS